MAKFYRELTPDLKKFIQKQKMFFTASAPTDGGRVNLSPKGYRSFALLSDTSLCYLDLPGSGNETANHIEDNRRLTLMWCSFDNKPLILRVYCYGDVIPKDSPEFDELFQAHFPRFDPRTVRQIIKGEIEAIQTSCGFAVPLYEFKQERELLLEWASKKVEQGKLEEYVEKNAPRNETKFPVEVPGE